jgi:hypothetical protein
MTESNSVRTTSARSGPRLLALLLALASGLAFPAHRAAAQGCVPIKEMGDQGVPIEGVTSTNGSDKWTVGENYEHFRSYLDFVGSQNNTPARAALTNQVINVVDQWDTSLTYDFDLRDSASIDVPYFAATRSQLVKNLGRFKTRSSGIGDTRVNVDRWLLNPANNPRGNISLGLGLNVPTGKSDVKDYFHTTAGLVYKNVDQSIQQGEGGWGYIFEGNAYFRIGSTTTLYANGFYMATPQDVNGTQVGATTTSETSFDSVYDQYEIRGGVTQRLWHFEHGVLNASFGGRWEGVPSNDLIGRSDGFRRPGYVLSIEPGLSLVLPHDSFSLSVPVAEYMNRTQSYPDTLTGGHGDAFFAKFLVLISYAHRW